MSEQSSSRSSRGRRRARPLPGGEAAPAPSVGGSSMSEVTSQVLRMRVSGRGPMSSEAASRIVAAVAAALPQAQMPEITALKPKMPFGTAGRPIDLFANYFTILLSTGTINVHRYEVNIVRPASIRRIDRDTNREVFWRAVKAHPEFFGKETSLIYDDMHCLWTATKLQMERGEETVKLMSQYVPDRVTFELNFKYTSTFTIDVGHDDAVRCMTVQFLDALLTQSPRCPLREVSDHFYPFGRSLYLRALGRRGEERFVHEIGPGLEAWNGIHGAVKIGAQGQALYNCDVSASAFARINMSVIEFYLDILNASHRTRNPVSVRDLEQSEMARNLAMDKTQRNRLKSGLAGLQMRITYGPERLRARLYKFVAVGDNAATAEEFALEMRDQQGNLTGKKEMISVKDYFEHVKKIPLQFPNLPLIQVGPKQRKIFIPMELLVLSEKPQKIKRNLTEFEKSALLRRCAYDPTDRMSRIEYMVDAQKIQESDFINNYAVQVEPKFVRIQGRVITPPKLAFKRDEINKYHTVEVKDGQWQLRTEFTQCHQKMVLCVVNVGGCLGNGPRDKENTDRCLNNLMSACDLFGMKWATETRLMETWYPENVAEFPAMLEYFKKETETHFPGAEVIVLCVMAGKNSDTYKKIKRACDLEAGVACQCILKKTFDNMGSGNPQTSATAHNICLKVNVKMGGINNRVYPTSESWIKFTNSESPTLHVGVDVTHPASHSKVKYSIASVVANMDPEASRYEATIKVQLPSEERVVYMVEALQERLLAYYIANKRRPAHIIIYRDGISESEFLNTMREELGSAQAACMKLDETYRPTLSYVVVQKRHHTRFFVTRPSDGVGRPRNIPPGTIVEEYVTSQSYSDFFMASHTGAIGTTRPCHYHVLYDSWNCTSDEWQELLFGLCHLYCRCNKSVSLPAPVFYAHLACARASVHSDALDSGGSSYGPRSVAGQRPSEAASKQESVRVLQSELAIAKTTPRMYFV